VSDGADKSHSNKPVSLLLLEGYTEEVFYSIIRDKFLKGIRVELRNIKGQGNINKDIAAEIFKYAYNNPLDLVRAYCCVDRETQNITATPLSLSIIRKEIKKRNIVQVLSVNSIIADPDIESWFFYDIEGIFKFLKVQKSKRNPSKYKIPQSFCKKNLQRLFEDFGKVYISGNRAENFIKHLDINIIVSNCEELKKGIELIRAQS